MQIKTEIKDICLNGGDIERMVAAMAQQIVQGEGAAASPVLVGLNTKGLAIAKRLARHMALLCGVQPPIGHLEIACGESLSASDTNSAMAGGEPIGGYEVQSVDLPFCIDGAAVVVVDDVAFTGRTARKALDVLGGIGTPVSLQLAVLVDRLFPNPAACPNVAGIQLDVSANERLLVFLEEIDGFSEVLVRRGW